MKEIRDIIYRGIQVSTKEMHTGSLCVLFWEGRNVYSIKDLRSPLLSFEVIPETVGEFINEVDKNGKQIFEDDILGMEFETDVTEERIIIFKQGHRWMKQYEGTDTITPLDDFDIRNGVVEGNIHEGGE